MVTQPLQNQGPTGDLVVDLHDVHKTYRGRVHALRGVEMQVHRGEVFGLLGPNGAGKSTLVKIMLTVVRPTQAHGTMLGQKIGHKPTLARVGYLPEHHRFPKYLTGRQVLEFYAALSGVDRNTRKGRASELLETVGMTEWQNKRIGSYSKGMMQRVGLAQAMMNDPDLIVLDEPTDGVDPVGRREIRDVLIELKHRGTTVFLNSHLLSELEMVCDRVAIMVQGLVTQQGAIEELTRESQRYEIVVEGKAPDWIDQVDDLRCVPVNGDKGGVRLVKMGADADPVQPILDRLRAESRTIRAVTPVRESLEDLFMRAVKDPNTGGVLKPGAAKDKTGGAA